MTGYQSREGLAITPAAATASTLSAPRMEAPQQQRDLDLMWRFANSINAAPGSLNAMLTAYPNSRVTDPRLNQCLDYYFGLPQGSVQGVQLREQPNGFVEMHLVMPNSGYRAAVVIERSSGRLHHPMFDRAPRPQQPATSPYAAPRHEIPRDPQDAMVHRLGTEYRDLLVNWNIPGYGTPAAREQFTAIARSAFGLPDGLNFTVETRRVSDRGLTHVFMTDEASPRMLGAVTIEPRTGQVWTNRYTAWRQRDLENEIFRQFNVPPGTPGYRFTYDRANTGDLSVTLWLGRRSVGSVVAARDYTAILQGPGTTTTTGTNNLITTFTNPDGESRVTRIQFRNDPSTMITVDGARAFLLQFQGGRTVQVPIAQLQATPEAVTFLSYEYDSGGMRWRWIRHSYAGSGDHSTREIEVDSRTAA